MITFRLSDEDVGRIASTLDNLANGVLDTQHAKAASEAWERAIMSAEKENEPSE